MKKSKKKFIVIFLLSIYFLAGITIYNDYGIGIEEHFQRLNGFYWLNHLLSFYDFFDLKKVVNLKFENILLANPSLPIITFFNFS